MRLAALFSGGKDSVFATYLMEQQGHEVEYLVNIRPGDPHSWVFHTPNLGMVPLMAEAMGKTLVAVDSPGTGEGDLAALRGALCGLKIDGVVTGAIASDYQWDRINHVCDGLGLNVYSPLWRKDQDLLMTELIDAGIWAVLVSVSSEGLSASWLGRGIDPGSLDELRRVARDHGMNLAGEGGEYETLVLDSPLHRRAIMMVEWEIETTRDSGSLRVTKAVLEEKE
jgi:ABC transporter with metal-binding/Fe-S-binding domain ATP-binding protein